MAGGRGSRLGYVEKPMIRVCNKFIIENMLEAASDIVERIYVAVSKYTPRTIEWCKLHNIPIIETDGDGYVNDLKFILKKFDRPILVLPSDTPFLTTNVLKDFIGRADDEDVDVITLVVERSCFPHILKCYGRESIGISLFKGYKNRWRNIRICKFPDLLDIDTIYELNYARRICNESSWRRFIR